MRQFAIKTAFVIALASALYFALLPNDHRDLLRILPAPIRNWCGMNDDLSNFLFFGTLAFLSFRLRRSGDASGEEGPWPVRIQIVRLAALLGLAAALEIAQIWIPGRFSSLRDVWMCWGGILVAWIISMGVDLSRRLDTDPAPGDLS